MTAVASLERYAAELGAKLPSLLPDLLDKALHRAGTLPARNWLTPGCSPVEYSFSSRQPRDLRMAAQLYPAATAPQRIARTMDLIRRLAGPSADLLEERDFTKASRFGAFFGMTAGPDGLTGVEAYIEAAVVGGPPGGCWPELRAVLRPVFTGLSARGRRFYLSVTRDLPAAALLRAVVDTVPPRAAAEMLAVLHGLTGGRGVLPAGSVMVTASPVGGLHSVELSAPAFGLSLRTLPAQVPSLRTADYARWLIALGADAACPTVVSIRCDARGDVGTAVYAALDTIQTTSPEIQPTSPASRPTACPSTVSARTRPVA